tara:strand:+ start:832 stop:1410 length:579 start_codon:yes stop_codon:yes gene_type:complete
MPIIFSGGGGTLASAPAASKIAQVQSNVKQGAWIYRYYNGWIDTGLSLNITPTASNSTILVTFHVYCSTRAGSDDSINNMVEARLKCNNNEIFNGNQADNTSDIIPSDPTNLSFMGSNTFQRVTGALNGRDNRLGVISHSYLHSPNSTSNQNYKVEIRRPNGAGYSHYLFHGRNFDGGTQAPSSIIGMEVRA